MRPVHVSERTFARRDGGGEPRPAGRARAAPGQFPCTGTPGQKCQAEDGFCVNPDKLQTYTAAGTVDDERAEPQPGAFYGGWITSDVVGPFKGGPGTMGW